MSESDKSSRPQRGLGKGLSALLGDVALENEQPAASQGAGAAAPGPVTQLGIDQLRRNPGQPRKDFNEDDLNALAASIQTHGILQPLLVRPVAGEPGQYEIVAGERRWRASQAIGLAQVPVVVREIDDLGTLEAAIVENLQRADLNPLEEAMAFQQLMDRFARTQQSVADQVGKSRAHVANTLRLLSLPQTVQLMVRDGQLSAGHARAVMASSDPSALARTIVQKGLNVRQAEKAAKASAAPGEAIGAGGAPYRSSPETSDDADARALAADLSAALGLDVAILPGKGQSGHLQIGYGSFEQLDDLCRRLTSVARK